LGSSCTSLTYYPYRRLCATLPHLSVFVCVRSTFRCRCSWPGSKPVARTPDFLEAQPLDTVTLPQVLRPSNKPCFLTPIYQLTLPTSTLFQFVVLGHTGCCPSNLCCGATVWPVTSLTKRTAYSGSSTFWGLLSAVTVFKTMSLELVSLNCPL
jgi:hypothetical protein